MEIQKIVVGLGVLQLFSTKLDDAPLPGFWNHHRPNLLERRLPLLRQRQAIAKNPVLLYQSSKTSGSIAAFAAAPSDRTMSLAVCYNSNGDRN
jgi:hypothetical protein